MGLTVLDAGVVIALLAQDDAHHAAARRELSSARARGDRLVLPAAAYAETLVAPYRRGPEAASTVDAFLEAMPVSVEPISREVAARAAQLRADHPTLRLPDALVIATAIVLNAERLLTTDQRWPSVGVTVQVI